MNINPEDFYSKEDIEKAKLQGQLARKYLGDSYMSDAELTHEERESMIPIVHGSKGLYRMYRWECRVCAINGKKMPYSEAIVSGYQHVIEYGHKLNPRSPPVSIHGGNFKREELYKE